MEAVYRIIKEYQPKILRLWKERFFASFGESANYLAREKDPFQNPLASRIEEVFSSVLSAVGPEFSWDKVLPYLERLAQVMAIYADSVRIAGEVFIQLKSLIREEFGEEILNAYQIEGLLKLEDLINLMMLFFLDYFFNFKMKLSQLKYEEWRRNNYLLLKRAGLIYDPLEGMPLEREIKNN